jgi:hypothetical protein
LIYACTFHDLLGGCALAHRSLVGDESWDEESQYPTRGF